MHEKRNFVLVLLLAVTFLWTGWAWIYADSEGGYFMRIISTGSFLYRSTFLKFNKSLIPDVWSVWWCVINKPFNVKLLLFKNSIILIFY